MKTHHSASKKPIVIKKGAKELPINEFGPVNDSVIIVRQEIHYENGNKEDTYPEGSKFVMPDPKIRIVDEKLRLTGKRVLVDIVNDIHGEPHALDYLKEAGLYTPPDYIEVKNGPVYFDTDNPIKDWREKTDSILSCIDEHKFGRDMKKNGYAILMSKENNFILHVNRIIQGIVAQKIPDKFGLKYKCNHLSLQESIEKMQRDEHLRNIAKTSWIPNAEIIIGDGFSYIGSDCSVDYFCAGAGKIDWSFSRFYNDITVLKKVPQNGAAQI
jgi:hypothetical protein